MKWKLCALLLVAGLPALAGGEGAEPAATATPHGDQRLLPRTLVYDCSGFEFVTRVGPGEMALWLPGRYLVLSQVRSASGSKYQEGDIVFWSKGDNAMLQLGDVEYPQCRLQPERAPWADARRRDRSCACGAGDHAGGRAACGQARAAGACGAPHPDRLVYERAA